MLLSGERRARNKQRNGKMKKKQQQQQKQNKTGKKNRENKELVISVLIELGIKVGFSPFFIFPVPCSRRQVQEIKRVGIARDFLKDLGNWRAIYQPITNLLISDNQIIKGANKNRLTNRTMPTD